MHCEVCNWVYKNLTFTGSLHLIGLVRCCTLNGDEGLHAWCKIYIIGQTRKSPSKRENQVTWEWEGQTTYSHSGNFGSVQL